MKTNTTFRKLLISTAICACFTTAGIGLASAADEPKPHSDGIGAMVNDTVITSDVKAKFLKDSRLDKSDISVTTTNGVVTLTGTATSKQSGAAKEIASSVDGVKSVDNQITTPSAVDTIAAKTDKAAKKTGKYASDSWITTKVKSSLLADSVTKGLDISVKTKGGVVILSGSVASEDVVDQAKKIAQDVKGVKSVDTDGLKVASN
jgi:hyperosmotically inducible protein